MSDLIRYPATAVEHLVLAALAADATLLGADVAEIEVRPLNDGLRGDAGFVLEAGVLTLRGATARRVVVPPGVAVTVEEAQGDLRVAELGATLTLHEVAGTLRLTQLAGPVRIGHASADIRAADIADLVVAGACEGDLRVDAAGSLSGEIIRGDVRLRDIAGVRLERVQGDLWIEQVRNALQVARADGDVRLHEVAGPAGFHEILGDLRAGATHGGLSVRRVSGDAILAGPFDATDGYELEADGDISISLPAGADVRLLLRAGGRIRSDLLLTPTSDGSPIYTTVLGRGASKVSLVSAGDVRVTQAGGRHGPGAPRESQFDDLADLNNLGERIRQQVQASLAAAGIRAPDARPPVRQERPRASAAERVKPAPKAVSAEEQLAILTMVQSGAIGPEEAELLLRALES